MASSECGPALHKPEVDPSSVSQNKAPVAHSIPRSVCWVTAEVRSLHAGQTTGEHGL